MLQKTKCWIITYFVLLKGTSSNGVFHTIEASAFGLSISWYSSRPCHLARWLCSTGLSQDLMFHIFIFCIPISHFSCTRDSLATCPAWDSKPYAWNFLVPWFFPGSASHFPPYHISLKPLSLSSGQKNRNSPWPSSEPWKSKPSYSRLLLWQFKAVHLMLSYLRQHFPFPSSIFKGHFKGFLDI